MAKFVGNKREKYIKKNLSTVMWLLNGFLNGGRTQSSVEEARVYVRKVQRAMWRGIKECSYPKRKNRATSMKQRKLQHS